MSSELNFKPAHELAGLVRSKQLSPVDLLQASLDRIAETDDTLNAWVGMRPEEAMQEARDLEAKIAKGEDIGSLAGLPFGVKELDDLAGFPTTHGSIAYKDNFPERDSVEVERLRKAGAIALGKTNAPEFGYSAVTKNRLFGITRNPWNPERTSGGSSGGSSSAVASGQVPMCTGSDGGGSIRIPACWTGLFGMKVSFGRVPMAPRKMLGWNDTSVHGPMVRTVRDAAMYIDAVVGTHEADPNCLPHPGYKYADVLEKLPEKLRIAWSPNLGYAISEPDIMRECEAAVKAFESMGYQVEEVGKIFDDPGTIWSRISGAEVWAEIYDKLDEHRDEFGHSFLTGAEGTRNITPEKYGKSQRIRAKLVDQLWHFFENYDLLLTPTLPVEALDARGAWPTRIAGRELKNPLHVVAFTYPFNLSGHPAASVRAGFSDSGMPVGLQIVGGRHRDDLVLQASYAYEQARPWNDKWPVKVPAFAG
jgi:aspartyl-tRNA(Asn)/glutamyl-tRNA(Gln) amidotransferase subunit A